MRVIGYASPAFTWVEYDLAGMSLQDRLRFLWRNPPRIRFTKDWQLTIIEDSGRRVKLVFPMGFVTDCASVPRLFWLIPGFSPFGALRPGSLPHDMGYQYGYLLVRAEDWVPLPTEMQFYLDHRERFGEYRPVYVGRVQKFFDKMMKSIVNQVSHATVSAAVAYGILRGFGKRAWNKYRRQGPGAYGDNSLDLPGTGELDSRAVLLAKFSAEF